MNRLKAHPAPNGHVNDPETRGLVLLCPSGRGRGHGRRRPGGRVPQSEAACRARAGEVGVGLVQDITDSMCKCIRAYTHLYRGTKCMDTHVYIHIYIYIYIYL